MKHFLISYSKEIFYKVLLVYGMLYIVLYINSIIYIKLYIMY